MTPIVSRSKSKWYQAKKVWKYALNSQLQSLQILTNDDEVENWSLSSFFLAVPACYGNTGCGVFKWGVLN